MEPANVAGGASLGKRNFRLTEATQPPQRDADMRLSFAVLISLSIGCLFANRVPAQTLQLDATFTPRLLTDTSITSVTAQPDGKFLVYGGEAAEANGVPVARVLRLNANGTLDTTFTYSEENWDSSLLLTPLPNGQTVIRRGPSNGNLSPSFLRLNADGSRDPTFASQTTSSPFILSLWAVDSSRRVYALTTSIGSREVIRYNANGSVDPNYDVIFTRRDGTSAPIVGLAMLPDEKLLVAGTFAIGGSDVTGFTRITANGVRDPSYTYRGTFTALNRVFALPDGRLLVQGSVTPGGLTTSLYRTAQDGTLDSAFTFAESNVTITAIHPLADGRVLVGFTRDTIAVGQRRNAIAVYTATGALDRELGSAAPSTTNFTLLAPTPDGGAVVSSPQTSPSTTTTYHLLQPNGSIVSNFLPTLRGLASLSRVMPLADGSVLVQGGFSAVNGADRSINAHLARDGSVTRDFGTDPSSPPTGVARSYVFLTERADGSIIVLAPDPGRARNGLFLLRRDGTTDPGFAYDITLPTATIALVLTNGNLLVGTWAGTGATSTPGLALLAGDGKLIRKAALPVIGAAVTTLQYVAGGRIGAVLQAAASTTAASVPRFLRFNPDLTLDQTYDRASADLSNDAAFWSAGPAITSTFDGGFVGLSDAGQLNQQIRRYLANGTRLTTFPARPSFGNIFAALLPRADETVLTIEHRYQDFAKRIRIISGDTTLATTDLELDASFTTSASYYSVANAPDGAVYIGSGVRSVGGQRRFGLARLVSADMSLIIVHPTNTVVVAGRSTSLRVTSRAGTSYQWRFNGNQIPGATTKELLFESATAAQIGTYDVIVTDGTRAETSKVASLSVAPNTAHLVNLSGAVNVGPGSERAFAGLVVHDRPRRILVRGVGPGLAALGVTNALAAAQLNIYSGIGSLAENLQWDSSAALRNTFTSVGAFPLPNGSRDAALALEVPIGDASAILAPADGTSRGAAVIEFYDLEEDGSQAIRNLSVRGNAGSAGAVLTAGFVVRGNGPVTVLIRGVGPGLRAFGVTSTLTDPRLRLFDQKSTTTPYVENDDWSRFPAEADFIAAAAERAGAFALAPNSKDAALLVRLEPGAYTAQISSADGTAGDALVEIYLLEN